MAQSMKRKCAVQRAPAVKKAKSTPPALETPVKRDLLELLYPCVQTLRQYLLSKLPGSSRLRRKKIAALGQGDNCRDIETLIAHLFDTTLVCTSEQDAQEDEAKELRWQQWLSFSQKGDESYVTLSGGLEGAFYSQSEVRCHISPLNFADCPSQDSRLRHMVAFLEAKVGFLAQASTLRWISKRLWRWGARDHLDPRGRQPLPQLSC